MALPFVNQETARTPDMSPAPVIGVRDPSFVAARVNNRTMVNPVEIFLSVGAVCVAHCLALDRLAIAAGRGFGGPPG